MSKYKSQKNIVDDIEFDSKIEASYYIHLKWLKKNKAIKDFEIQPKFLLQEAFEKNGKKFRKIEYTADFKVIQNDGTIDIIDVKGFMTDVAKIKVKLFEKRYPYKLTLLTYVKKYGGWITLDKVSNLRKKERKKKV